MALYDDIVSDAQRGLFDFEGWILTEGNDFRLESDTYLNKDGNPFDFTVLTGVVSRVYDAKENAILTMTWEPHVEGWFALTCSDGFTSGLALGVGVNAERRPVKVNAYGDLPDGRRIQLVDGTSTLWIAQKGQAS